MTTKRAISEPYLLSGYESLRVARDQDQPRTQEGLAPVIALYEKWCEPDKAAEYRRVMGR
jgi:hypothetical protein